MTLDTLLEELMSMGIDEDEALRIICRFLEDIRKAKGKPAEK